MALTNIDNVSLYTENLTDKIVDVFTGSFDAATAGVQKDSLGNDVYSKLVIPHGLTRPVFTKLRWSTDNANWVDGGLSRSPSSFDLAIAYSDNTDVVVLSTKFTGTVYYQVICFWIDDYDGTDPDTPSNFGVDKPLAFDSSLNYQKIIQQGVKTVSGSDVVVHSAGYKPNAWVYFESNDGQVWPAILGGISNAWLYNYSTQREIEYSISSTSLSLLVSGGSGSARVWYRIYAEGV